MNKRDIIRIEDLTEADGGPFLPICFCLDTSISMQATTGGTPTGEYAEIDGIRGPVVTGGVTRLELLQEAIQGFCNTVYADELARYTIEFSVVTFDDTARQLTQFSGVEFFTKDRNGRLCSKGCYRIPKLKANGERTSMGEGVNLALKLLEDRRQSYRDRGVDYYKPWLVLMSDGKNNGSPAEFAKAQTQIRELLDRQRLFVYPIAIGRGADLAQLNALSPEQEAYRLDPKQMKHFFDWLAQGSKVVSSGALGERKSPKLEHYTVDSWADGL